MDGIFVLFESSESFHPFREFISFKQQKIDFSVERGKFGRCQKLMQKL